MAETRLSGLMVDRMAAVEADELSMPHIVITRDVPTAVVTYSGPYPNALEAMVAADRERCRQTMQDPDWEVTFSVAPLCAPADEGHRPGCDGEACVAGPPRPEQSNAAERAEPVKVYLLSADRLVRRDVGAVLAADAEVQIVGQSVSSAHALLEIAELGPDVVLVDLQLADGSALRVCREVRETNPDIRFLILATGDEADLVSESHISQAASVVLKGDLSGPSLLHAIKFVASGHMLIDSGVARRLFDQWAARRKVPDGVADMTRQQSKVLLLLAAGMSNREIARRLNLSERTVRDHVTGILACLGVASRTEAALIGNGGGAGADVAARKQAGLRDRKGSDRGDAVASLETTYHPTFGGVSESG